MANCDGISSPDARCVLVETNLETNLATVVHKDEPISDFKAKFCKEHKECFPKVGEINITALKVKRRGNFFHMPDSMIMSKLFNSTSKSWFMYADLVRVGKGGLVTIMAADQNPELLEKKKETTIDTDGHTNDLTSGEALRTEVAKKQSKKRKSKSSDTKQSRKRPAIDRNQSKETLDIESCEKIGISMGENQQSSGAGQEKNITINSELVDKVKDVQPNQTPEEALGTEFTMGKSNTKLDDLTGALEQDLEKGEKTAELVKIDQDKDLAPTLEPVDGHTALKDDVNESHVCEKVQAAEHCVILPREKLDDILSGGVERDNKRGEESRLAPIAADSLQTAELVTFTDNQLEASSGLTTGPATEKRRKRKKSSTDHVSQSTAAVTSTSRDTVNEINGVPRVDATSESGLLSRRENLVNPLAEAIQKVNELSQKFAEELGTETDNQATYRANSPATERKKSRKKSSKDYINVAIRTTPKEIANEINANVDCVAAASESCPISGRGNLGDPLAVQKENDVVGSGKASDIIQTDNSAKDLENQLATSSGLTTGPATEKKRRRKKSSKDHIKQSSGAANTTEPFPNSRGEKLDDTLVEAIQNENDNSADKNNVGSKEATQIVADKLETVNSLEAAHALVQESKTLDHIGEHEVGKDDVEIETKFLKKSSKKKKSRKDERRGKEGSLVGPGAEYVEAIKVVVDEGSDKVIRNVLDCLKENLEKSEKKSSKRLKKRSLNVEVEVNNADLPMEKPKDTERDAKESIEDQKEKADMGDNFEKDGKKQDDALKKKPKEKKTRVKAASLRVNKNTFKDFFKDAEKCDSTENEASYVDSLADDDSDVTYMSRKQGSLSLQDILRRSTSYKKAKLSASQSQPDDESLALVCVPDSQPN